MMKIGDENANGIADIKISDEGSSIEVHLLAHPPRKYYAYTSFRMKYLLSIPILINFVPLLFILFLQYIFIIESIQETSRRHIVL